MTTIDRLLTEARRSWDDPSALARIGKELHDRNRLPAAREVLGRALGLDPKVSDEAWNYLAFSHWRDYGDAEGFATIRRGIEVTDSDSLRSTLLGFSQDEAEQAALRERLEKSDDPAIRADLEWAKAWGGDAEALRRVKALREANPDNKAIRATYAWMLLGARRQGRGGLDLREEGVPLAREIIRDEPASISGYSLKDQMLFVEQDWAALLAATEETLAVFPDDETTMHLRALAFQNLGDEERAAHWFARAIGAKPSFAGARRDLGKLYEKQGKLELAEEMFREIPRANPSYPVGPVSLALFLARREKWEEAEKLLIQAWPGLPDWAKGSLGSQPDAAALMARDAVKQVVNPEE